MLYYVIFFFKLLCLVFECYKLFWYYGIDVVINKFMIGFVWNVFGK